MGIEGFCICVGKMARTRNPIEVSIATGHTAHDPKRYRDRTSFTNDENPPLGEPEKSTSHRLKKLWADFKKEWPWLRESDRAAIGALVIMRAKLDTPEECDAKFFKQYFDALKAFGGTPAERTKMPKDKKDADKSDDDDGDKYVNWN